MMTCKFGRDPLCAIPERHGGRSRGCPGIGATNSVGVGAARRDDEEARNWWAVPTLLDDACQICGYTQRHLTVSMRVFFALKGRHRSAHGKTTRISERCRRPGYGVNQIPSPERAKEIHRLFRPVRAGRFLYLPPRATLRSDTSGLRSALG